MKISELIEELSRLKDGCGDVEVTYYFYNNYYDLRIIEVHEDAMRKSHIVFREGKQIALPLPK